MKEDRQPSHQRHSLWKNARPTIGLLTLPFSTPFWTSMWSGVADVAREQDVNLLCFTGGLLDDSMRFLSQANVLYNLVDVGKLDGLVIWNMNKYLVLS